MKGFDAGSFGTLNAEDYDHLVSEQYSAYIDEAQQAELGLKKARFFGFSLIYNWSADTRLEYNSYDIDLNRLRGGKLTECNQ